MGDYQVFMKQPPSFDTRLQGAGCYCEYAGKILVLKRHPLSEREGGTWCIPGGGVEEGETPLVAARREVFEEIGIKLPAKALKKLGLFYIQLPELEYVFHTFRTVFIEEPIIKLALEEHTEARWVSAKEALKLPLIRGGKETLKHYLQVTGLAQ